MSMTAKRARELEAEIGRLDFGRDPPPCLDEACEYLRAYADSLERAPNEPPDVQERIMTALAHLTIDVPDVVTKLRER